MPRLVSVLSRSTQPRFAPVDLASVPAVDELLDHLGYGSFVPTEVTAAPGRNDIWIGLTTSGRRIFVKRLTGSREYVDDRLSRLEAFERVRPTLQAGGLLAPELLAVDTDHALCAFSHVDNGVSGAQLAGDGTFTDSLARVAGHAIGAVHALPSGLLGDLGRAPIHMPSPELLLGLPTGMYELLTMAELDSWRLLQQDDVLRAAIDRLCAEERSVDTVPSHCDLRLDQMLVVENSLYITDWEEFRLADPARDLGNYVGQWLQRAMLDLVSPVAGAPDADDLELTDETVKARGVQSITRLRPRIQSFWHAYRGHVRGVDDRLAVRATAFAGWHLLDRLLASAHRTSKVSGIDRAAAGIGRSALVHPERFAVALGLDAAA